MFNHTLIRMMPGLLLLLAGMGFVTNTLHKYKISGTIYSTSENGVDKVMPDMHIDLMEKDGLGNDNDHLGDAVTDGQGHFEVVGEEDEEEKQEPYLRIHIDDCDSLWKVCEGFRPYGLEAISIDRIWGSRLKFFSRGRDGFGAYFRG